MNIDPESIKAAARLLYLAALENNGAVFAGLETEGEAHALILALSVDTEEEMIALLDRLRQIVGDAVPSGAAHLDRLQGRTLALN